MNGLIIVLEGLNGLGKSTVAQSLQTFFESRGRLCTILRDPGTSPVGEKIRAIVKDPDLHPEPYTTLFLYQAAKLEMLPEIHRLYTAGYIVILDRWWQSTYAYQGAMGIDSSIIRGQVQQFGLNFPGQRYAAFILTVDSTADLPLLMEEAKQAAIAKGEKPDRWENAQLAYLQEVDSRYRDLHRESGVFTVFKQGKRTELGVIIRKIRLGLAMAFHSHEDLMEALL